MTYGALFVVAVLLAVAFSAYQRQIGVAAPSRGSRHVVGSLGDVERAAQVGAYPDYADSVRVAHVTYRRFDIDNPADAEIRGVAGRALDLHETARRAWQLEVEDAWDDSIHGSSAYWTASQPGIQIVGEATPETVRNACWERAGALVLEAAALAEE